jgi:hypothetical protein
VTAFSLRASHLHSLLYIWTPNRGNAAAKYDRAKELAASALAAYTGYCGRRRQSLLQPRGADVGRLTASTRKVKTPEYTQMTTSDEAVSVLLHQ